MRGGMGEVVSGGSNERRKWARAEEVGIRPRVEAIHLSGGDGIPCRAAEEAGEEGGGPLGVGEVELGGWRRKKWGDGKEVSGAGDEVILLAGEEAGAPRR